MGPAFRDVVREGGEAIREASRAVGEVVTEFVELVGRLTELEEVGLVGGVLEVDVLEERRQGGLVLAGVLHGPSIPLSGLTLHRVQAAIIHAAAKAVEARVMMAPRMSMAAFFMVLVYPFLVELYTQRIGFLIVSSARIQSPRE